MPQTKHIESHFTASATVRDIVIGMSDGLTVPFALAAGLTGAVDSAAIVITAGLAEIAAGSIAMGLGGYLAARSDFEHYESELRREHKEIVEIPEEEKLEVEQVLVDFGLSKVECAPIIEALARRPDDWVRFMMRFELGIEAPDPKRAVSSAVTIALAYIAGGLVPLLPYMFLSDCRSGFAVSVVLTILALFVFGFVKGRFTSQKPLQSGLQTVLIGGLAAGVAFGVARLISR